MATSIILVNGSTGTHENDVNHVLSNYWCLLSLDSASVIFMLQKVNEQV